MLTDAGHRLAVRPVPPRHVHLAELGAPGRQAVQDGRRLMADHDVAGQRHHRRLRGEPVIESLALPRLGLRIRRANRVVPAAHPSPGPGPNQGLDLGCRVAAPQRVLMGEDAALPVGDDE
jgi:hypothetical protein